jgi:hypothetical protein
MKKQFSLWSISMLALFLMMQESRASGYLTPLRAGIEVTDYMVNNNTGSGNIGGLTIWVSGISNPDGCTGTDKVHIKNSATGYKEMVAAVLSAVALGKKIGFHSSGCEGLPFWGGTLTYPMVSDLWIVN